MLEKSKAITTRGMDFSDQAEWFMAISYLLAVLLLAFSPQNAILFKRWSSSSFLFFAGQLRAAAALICAVTARVHWPECTAKKIIQISQ